jgi:RNA polymerase sigma-70 factor (ECF subfamily)
MVSYNSINASGALEPFNVSFGVLLSTLKLDTSISHPDSDSELIQRAQLGDGKAFDTLVVRYQKALYYSIIRIVLNPEEANDVVQEAFIKAYRNLDNYDKQFRFYTWIYRIAVNTALNVVRRRRLKEDSLEKKSEDTQFDPPNIDNQDTDCEIKDISQYVLRALDKLPFEMRTVFIMKVFDEMSYKEIADMLDLTVGTVMSRLNRARTILRKLLNNSEIAVKKSNLKLE